MFVNYQYVEPLPPTISGDTLIYDVLLTEGSSGWDRFRHSFTLLPNDENFKGVPRPALEKPYDEPRLGYQVQVEVDSLRHNCLGELEKIVDLAADEKLQTILEEVAEPGEDLSELFRAVGTITPAINAMYLRDQVIEVLDAKLPRPMIINVGSYSVPPVSIDGEYVLLYARLTTQSPHLAQRAFYVGPDEEAENHGKLVVVVPLPLEFLKQANTGLSPLQEQLTRSFVYEVSMLAHSLGVSHLSVVRLFDSSIVRSMMALHARADGESQGVLRDVCEVVDPDSDRTITAAWHNTNGVETINAHAAHALAYLPTKPLKFANIPATNRTADKSKAE